MVNGLAERLKREPDDVEGWLRLIRSYVVMGRPQDAATAARAALQGLQEQGNRERVEALIADPRRRARRGGRAMTRKKRRLLTIGASGALLAVSAALVLFALREQIVFFYSPTDVAQKAPAAGTRLRLGGLVLEGSCSGRRTAACASPSLIPLTACRSPFPASCRTFFAKVRALSPKER
jgi:hypothetical protein